MQRTSISNRTAERGRESFSGRDTRLEFNGARWRPEKDSRPRVNHPTARRRGADRRGSTLLVVIGLMGLLALLGFVFYTFAAQEQLNASYYAEGAQGSEPDLDYFDWALEQLIVGPRDGLKNSILWGKRHAMLTNQFGNDLHPHNGKGINLINPSNPQVDQNYDGTADALVDNNANGIHDTLEIVDSPVAWNRNQRLDWQNIPTTDVDYTYPDINHCFLAYKGKLVEDGSTALLVPSFVRPQILRNGAGPIWDWSTNPATAARSFRPHPSHLHKTLPTSAGPPVKRFLDDSNPLDLAIIATLPATGATLKGFPFKVDTNANGVNNEIGVWTPTGGAVKYELDVDTDGEGINDAIWMDLDYAVLETSTGVKYVPLFAFQVLDADALFDLNTHSQIDRNVTIPGLPATPFGGAGKYLSKSNQGVGPIEVNLGWGLNIDPRGPDHIAGTADDLPAATFTQYLRFFGRNPYDHIEGANMDTVFLKEGRAELSAAGFPAAAASVTNLYTGVFGEADLLYRWITTGNTAATTYPKPGYTNFSGQSMQPDDDYNQLSQEGAPVNPSNIAFGQPLDMTGTGSFLLPGNPKAPNLQPALGGGNPSQWLQYNGYATQGTIPYYSFTSGFASPLMINIPGYNPLIDDGFELVVEPNAAQKPADEILGWEDMAHLHLSDTVLGKVTHSKRLENQMPFNMSLAAGVSNPDLRQRFTVHSHSRRTFGLAETPNATWADANGDGKLEFPPQFSGSTAYSATDPFRIQVRRLLETEYGNITKQKPQMRLSVNGVLDIERNPGVQPNLTTGRLIFRPLTPHPTGLSNTALPVAWTSANPPQYPPQTVQEMEWWARYDRQVLARDIFVLLYAFGGLDTPAVYNPFLASNKPYNAAGDGVIYTKRQMQQMAQFAVNLVDALDRDTVITRFEFDRDLSDGWNLDDNPMTDPSNSSLPDTADRDVVYGVESQQLSFSEVLTVKASAATPAGTNHAATEWNDTADRYFSYVELRNASPYTQDFTNQQWMIGYSRSNATPTDEYATNQARQLRLMSAAGTITPGGLFTIGTAGDTSVIDTVGTPPSTVGNPYSFMKVDPGWMSGAPSFSIIAPGGGTLNLDLIRDTAGPARYQVTDGGGTPVPALGSFLDDIKLAAVTDSVYFRLYRRLNPSRPTPTNPAEEADNPWVMVDGLTLSSPGIRPFSLTATDTAPAIQIQLAGLLSSERPEPLRRDNESLYTGGGNVRNTLSAVNLSTTTTGANPFTQWQPHFDRDFASPGELLSLPLYSPSTATRLHFQTKTPPPMQFPPVIASAKFLMPLNLGIAAGVDTKPGAATVDDDGNGTTDDLSELFWPGSDDNREGANRWYRLFEFIEVPTRMHRTLTTNPLELIREPGRVNLNTVRHPEVLAGLIDDRNVIDRTFTPANKFLPSQDATDTDPSDPNGIRDWWRQFIRSRDGVPTGAGPNLADPVTGLYLPGLAGSHPFRSFDFNSRGYASIEETLLRHLPLDGTAGRRLLELDTAAEYGAGGIDPYVRHRLLSKVFNSTTQRSNVFIVYVTVGFFEAYKVPVTGEIRVGGYLGKPVGSPGAASIQIPDQKGFFIIDRSYAEEAFDTGQFSFAKWRDLIKFSMKNY